MSIYLIDDQRLLFEIDDVIYLTLNTKVMTVKLLSKRNGVFSLLFMGLILLFAGCDLINSDDDDNDPVEEERWVYTETLIQFVEPYQAPELKIVDDVPWGEVFSGKNSSTIYSGAEFNVTRTKQWTNSNGQMESASKTDTWSELPAEMIPNQEYTFQMKSTRLNNLGNGMSISGFGTLEDALEGSFPSDFLETAFDSDGEKSIKIKVSEPKNDEDALKKRVIRVNLASGAVGSSTENFLNYLYVYEWM